MAKEGLAPNEGASSVEKTTSINRKRLTPFLVRTFYKIGGRFDTDAYTYQREIPQSSSLEPTTGK